MMAEGFLFFVDEDTTTFPERGAARSLEYSLGIGVAPEARPLQAGMVPLDGVRVHVAARPVGHGPGGSGRIPEYYSTHHIYKAE